MKNGWAKLWDKTEFTFSEDFGKITLTDVPATVVTEVSKTAVTDVWGNTNHYNGIRVSSRSDRHASNCGAGVLAAGLTTVIASSNRSDVSNRSDGHVSNRNSRHVSNRSEGQAINRSYRRASHQSDRSACLKLL